MAILTTETYKFVTKQEIAKLLNLKNPDSVKHSHKYWIDQVHYFKNPGGKSSGYSYNLMLIQHWIQCCRNTNDLNHLKAIAAYQRSLNPRKMT